MTDPTSPLPGPPSWGQPPPNPQSQPPNPQSPPPPKQRAFRAGFLGCFGVAAAVIVAVVVIAMLAASGSKDAAPNAATDRPRVTDAAAAATTDSPPAVTPKAKDFKLTVKVLSKQCFGSAGCSLTYRVDAGWPDGYDPDVEYEVVYEVRGGEDGPQINTMTVQGDSYERPQEESISTSSAGRRLTAVVTSVEET